MDKTDLYYQVAAAQLDEQERRNKDYEIKATGTITLSVALLAVVALVVKESLAGTCTYVAGSVSMLGFIGVLVCGSIIMWPRKWYHDPSLRDLEAHLENYDDEVLTRWAGTQLANSIEDNESILKLKSNWFIGSVGALALQVIGLFSLALLLASALKA